ncbi:MAG: MFS transporter [Acidimicrobiia bacterium]|nr:MFS transporter [Acidimicrobiia bacterium]
MQRRRRRTVSSLRRVIAGGDFRRLLVGQAVSGLGDWMATFALMALAWEVTSSTSAVGGILTLRLLPAALGGTVAARVSLRWDRRRTMLATDLLRVGIVAIIPLIAQLWWIYLWAFVLEATSVIFLSARDAAVPELVEADDLPTANSLMLGSSFGSIPVGAGAFAALTLLPFADAGWLASRPHAVVFWIDALTYLVSALLIARMAPLGRPAQRPTPVSNVGRLRDAAQVPLVRTVMPAAAAVALGLGALFSLGLSLVREELGASDLEFGILIAIFGVGAGAGLIIVTRLARPLLEITRYGTLGMGALVATMSLSPLLWLTYLGAFGFGLAATVALTSGMTALQSGTDDSQRGVAFAAFHMVIRMALGLAAAVAGAIGDALSAVRIFNTWTLSGTRLVLLASGILVVASAAAVRLVPRHRPDTGDAA